MTNDPKPKTGFRLPEPVRDSLLFIGQWLIVTVGIFAWWMGLQLVISFFAVNVWQVTFRQILVRSILLTAACSVGYLLVMLRRDEKRRK
jgi:hypothetical protein